MFILKILPAGNILKSIRRNKKESNLIFTKFEASRNNNISVKIIFPWSDHFIRGFLYFFWFWLQPEADGGGHFEWSRACISQWMFTAASRTRQPSLRISRCHSLHLAFCMRCFQSWARLKFGGLASRCPKWCNQFKISFMASSLPLQCVFLWQCFSLHYCFKLSFLLNCRTGNIVFYWVLTVDAVFP
jgi:hypothetical protein